MRTAWLIALAGCFRFDATPPPPASPDAPPVVDAAADAATLGEITQALLEQWSGCLSFANFQGSNMKAWGTLTATTNQQCQLCHGLGEEGFIATATNDQLFFDTITKQKFYLLQFFTVDLSAGGDNAKVIINTSSFIGVASAQPPHTEHPTFNATNNAGMTALGELYDRTVDRLVNGVCDPPRLEN